MQKEKFKISYYSHQCKAIPVKYLQEEHSEWENTATKCGLSYQGATGYSSTMWYLNDNLELNSECSTGIPCSICTSIFGWNMFAQLKISHFIMLLHKIALSNKCFVDSIKSRTFDNLYHIILYYIIYRFDYQG